MDETQKNKNKGKYYTGLKEDKFLPEFVNKVIVCETWSGKTITGVLAGYDRYTMLLFETNDIKSKTPRKTLVFKHGLVGVREIE